MAHSPAVLAAYVSLRQATGTYGTLGPRTRPALMLATAGAVGNAYTEAITSALALRAGWSQAEVLALRDGRSVGLPAAWPARSPPPGGSSGMELAQSRIVTNDVEGLAGFYARLLGMPVALNDYYVEIPAGPASVGFSRPRFTEYGTDGGPVLAAVGQPGQDQVVLDFMVEDVDAEYLRISALGVYWVMPPVTQPWGNRSMLFRDPAGNLINVFSRPPAGEH